MRVPTQVKPSSVTLVVEPTPAEVREILADAPADHNFDTLIEIQGLAEHIDGMAGIGPDSTNEIMPTDDPKPADDERRQLAEWLACGAP